MRVGISIETSAFSKLKSDVRKGVGKGIKEAGDVAAERVRATFDREGERDGMPPWQPTSQVALRNRKNPPARGSRTWKTLQDTGALYHSIHAEMLRDTDGSLEVEVRSSRQYAELMDQGGEASIDGRIIDVPARPFMDLVDPQDVNLLLDNFLDALEEAL